MTRSRAKIVEKILEAAKPNSITLEELRGIWRQFKFLNLGLRRDVEGRVTLLVALERSHDCFAGRRRF